MQTQTDKFVFSKRYLNLLVASSNLALSAKQMGDRLVVGRLKRKLTSLYSALTIPFQRKKRVVRIPLTQPKLIKEDAYSN